MCYGVLSPQGTGYRQEESQGSGVKLSIDHTFRSIDRFRYL